ncbi:glutamate racemase [Simkania negevensis]|uniref:Glutamate racemase n=1 Tax=Simkania negevensis TaxID=83561 RepID=A0ABS3ARM4_9BACT|nr:glutamate racemase [Simkania negevensis]
MAILQHPPGNMSEKSIGIFDSGIGGLTVLKAVRELLPKENIIYFGDTARVPYGNKSPKTIIRYAIENSIFLIDKEIKLLIIACNTASAYALDTLQRLFNIPIIGVITPCIERVLHTSHNDKIAILGTKGTISSEAYQQELKKKIPLASLYPIPCPLFVPLVEEYMVNHPITLLTAKHYLQPLKDNDVNTVILGCTHYPWLTEVLTDALGDNTLVIDSASSCAYAAKTVLQEQQLLSTANTPPTTTCYVSDDTDSFKRHALKLLDINIDSYFCCGYI